MFSASKTAGPSGYNINNSLRFRSSATAYLSRTFSSTGTNNKIQTFSAWVKRGLLSSSANYRLMGGYNGSASFSTEINFVNDNLRVEFGGSVQYELKTTQVFRDPSAWYHIVVAIDTTQATSSNRVKMYVNGSQITAFATANYPAQNDGSQLTSANANNKLGASWSNAEPFDGYMAEVNFIDGQALTPSSFGSTNATTGVWQPAKYTGTYGTNGFYLPFSDIGLTSGSNTGLGKDFSGNSNYWTTNNISVTAGTTYDAMIDSPTNASISDTQPVGNYCTLNPLSSNLATKPQEGNLYFNTDPSNNAFYIGTMGVSSGKWYWEYQVTSQYCSMGVTQLSDSYSYFPTSSGSLAYANYSGTKYNNGTSGGSYITVANGDKIGIALDLDSGTITMYKNNVSQGVMYSGLSGTFFPLLACPNTWGAGYVNFGQRPFAYTPPTGHKAICTTNLPDSTVVKGNTVMDATLYTGNGSAQTITNAGGFRPDLVWQKPRSEVASHRLVDSVRGVNNVLYSNQTAAASTETNTLTAFNSNGFTGGGSNAVTSSNTAVAWQWQAGQGTTSSNTSGSITSTVSVNATAGFSIVTYTGNATANATVGHGLGVTPKFFVVKVRSGTGEWLAYHISTGKDGFLQLQSTDAFASSANYWGSTGPTSTTFQINGGGGVNNNGSTYVAYCWAEIAGFSKIGSYTGNGSTDGPFVYTGFRPKFIMYKKTTTGTGNSHWWIFDSSRNLYNLTNSGLNPDGTYAENSTLPFTDFLSNGFKLRTDNGENNDNGQPYIYMAFAENPFKNALAR